MADLFPPSWLYSYKIMPFDLRNASATFQHLMSHVVAGLTSCAVYDLVVLTWFTHMQRFRVLFDCLSEKKLNVNLLRQL